MIDLFNDKNQRIVVATDIFDKCWEYALVTISMENGDKYFIN